MTYDGTEAEIASFQVKKRRTRSRNDTTHATVEKVTAAATARTNQSIPNLKEIFGEEFMTWRKLSQHGREADKQMNLLAWDGPKGTRN